MPLSANSIRIKFWHIASVYLLLLFLLFAFEPQFGDAPDPVEITVRLLRLLPAVLLFVMIKIIIHARPDLKPVNFLNTPRFLFALILVTTIIGFIFSTEYFRQVGCFGYSEQEFSPVKISVSGISVLLLALGYLFSPHYSGIALLLLEFIFCTLRSVYFNHTLMYFPGSAIVVMGWLARVALISKLLK